MEKRRQVYRQLLPLLACTLVLLGTSGCVSYRIPTDSFIESHNTTDTERVEPSRTATASKHWLYKVIPRHRSQIRWYDLPHWISWALFGNDDDGIFGEVETADYKPHKPINGQLALAWGIRNPFHNLCTYLSGGNGGETSAFTILKISKKDFEVLRYHKKATTVFADDDSCFYLAFHGWKPFISFRVRHLPKRRADFYLGWRERGNFGIKCQPAKRIKDKINPEDLSHIAEEEHQNTNVTTSEEEDSTENTNL